MTDNKEPRRLRRGPWKKWLHTVEAEFKASEVAAMEFEMGSVFEIFKEAIIHRKVSKMDIETATAKEVTLI